MHHLPILIKVMGDACVRLLLPLTVPLTQSYDKWHSSHTHTQTHTQSKTSTLCTGEDMTYNIKLAIVIFPLVWREGLYLWADVLPTHTSGWLWPSVSNCLSKRICNASHTVYIMKSYTTAFRVRTHLRVIVSQLNFPAHTQYSGVNAVHTGQMYVHGILKHVI